MHLGLFRRFILNRVSVKITTGQIQKNGNDYFIVGVHLLPIFLLKSKTLNHQCLTDMELTGC
jgi:hypothetical protein